MLSPNIAAFTAAAVVPETRALWYGPRKKHSLVFEAEVVVQVARQMLLDAEEARLADAREDRARRFGSLAEVALLPVFLERHGAAYVVSRLRLFSGRENTRKRKPAVRANAATAVNRFGKVIDS
jgi:hypothetical protein